MPVRRSMAAHRARHDQASRENKGELRQKCGDERNHDAPPLPRAFSISRSRLSRSSSVQRSSYMPTMAATAELAELSKNVRTRCRTADLLTRPGSTVGK